MDRRVPGCRRRGCFLYTWGQVQGGPHMCAEVGRRIPYAGDISGKILNFGHFFSFWGVLVYITVIFGFLPYYIHESGIQHFYSR